MPINNQHQSSKKNQLNNYARFSAMGIQMGVIIFLFVWGGQRLDQYLTLPFPVFTLTGSIIGIGAALYFVIRQLNNIQK
jgi:hypothetical protein